MKLFKSLDFFTKAKADVETSTNIGGLFSILGLCISILFIVFEFLNYQEFQIVKEMALNKNTSTRKERVNIDITFAKIPCSLITFILEEDGVEPIIGIYLQTEKINHLGQKIAKFLPQNDITQSNLEQEFDNLIDAIHNKEGCRIFGNFSISQVPGNFQFRIKDKIEIYKNLLEKEMKVVSLDFTLHHLTFGMDPNQKVILSRFPAENFCPYNNFEMKNVRANEEINIFTKIVGNYYELVNDAKNQGLLAYSFSATFKKKQISPSDFFIKQMKIGEIETSTLKFYYEFSPIHFTHKKIFKSSQSFFVDTLAIIGGIFSLMKILTNVF